MFSSQLVTEQYLIIFITPHKSSMVVKDFFEVAQKCNVIFSPMMVLI